jgi:hypothetical protein
MIVAVFIESSGNSQQADNRCETPWAQHSDVVAH